MSEERYSIREFRDFVQERIAESQTEEAQEVIHNDDTHVLEVWQDGEMTSTKSGDLYQRRNLHQSIPPTFPEGVRLFDVGGSGNTRRVVVDRELKEVFKRMTVEISIDRDFLDVEVVVPDAE